MNLDRIEGISATRILRNKDGRNIEILFGTPKRIEGEDDFYCPFQVKGMGDEKVRYAIGVDSFQALILSLKRLSIYVNALPEVVNGEIIWLDESNLDLGLT